MRKGLKTEQNSRLEGPWNGDFLSHECPHDFAEYFIESTTHVASEFTSISLLELLPEGRGGEREREREREGRRGERERGEEEGGKERGGGMGEGGEERGVERGEGKVGEGEGREDERAAGEVMKTKSSRDREGTDSL